MNINKKIQLSENEEIIDVVHPHLLFKFGRISVSAILIFVSAYFMFYLFSFEPWGKYFFVLLLIIAFYLFFSVWFLRRNNALIITNKKIIDINRISYFNEDLYSLEYEDIKDISVRKKGVLGALFGWGTILIESLTGKYVLEVEKIPQVFYYQNLILEIKAEYLNKKKISGKKNIYKRFKKLIPRLSEEKLIEIKDLISEELEERGEEIVQEE